MVAKKKIKRVHDCIGKARKELMNQDEDTQYIRFKWANIESFEDSKRVGETKTAQEIQVGYIYTHRDGSKTLKERKSFVTHIYCPFCGKKYE